MGDDESYLSTNEAALSVVATAMKKARLRLDTLAINSLLGGMVFTTGGMLMVLVEADCPDLMKNNPGIIHLLQGLMYPIGLFYVVILGLDLFNANVLYFTTALCRNAVSVIDLAISWFVSWWLNLVGNIFVCYIICHYSHVTSNETYAKGSVDLLMDRMSYSFVQTMLKGVAGNFYTCLAVYLQLMARPLHVKLLLMTLPIFSFVSMGFTHTVSDMYLVVIGLINHTPVAVRTVIWKLIIPGVIGNIIGGSFFAVSVWYLHLVVVERDEARLNLPKYDYRDRSPTLNSDSRVTRNQERQNSVQPNFENYDLAKSPTAASRFSTNTLNAVGRSPRKVFPVYDMGPPSEREREIASGSNYSVQNFDGNSINDQDDKSAEYIGDQLSRAFTRNSIRRDSESRVSAIDFPRRRARSFSSIGPRQTRPSFDTVNANHSFRKDPEAPKKARLKTASDFRSDTEPINPLETVVGSNPASVEGSTTEEFSSPNESGEKSDKSDKSDDSSNNVEAYSPKANL